ncbi:MAG: ABC transporter permease, partial [Burkholderiaceae bacterium]
MSFFSLDNSHPDPAWHSRITGVVIAIVLLVPMLVASEFKPWTLIDAQSLSATWRFLAGFFPPAHSLEFFQQVAAAT